MPPPTDPREIRRTDGNGYPHPDINDTRSLISRLTSEPRSANNELPAASRATAEPENTLIYPDPTPNPDVKPKNKPVDLPSLLQPRASTTLNPRNLQTPEASVPPESGAYPRGWRGDNDPPTLSLRSPTLAPTLMMQLVNRISALCADWSAISPDIACSTCAIDASKLNLDIHLATALTNEGLATLCAEGLIQAQTLCRMMAVMMMNLGTISEESTEMLTQEYDRDTQLLFVGVDLQKVRFLLVEERQVMGWQLTFDVPAMPRMGTVDEMLDTLYDYDSELYGDGES
ncbi:hypothetical protein Moror_3474 [Moniliophthora roreri MCA 2997]|uniref:Reverse transcriptase-rnase h-integrase n=1 Tax=Moniliophthora roreri (strain MCA 2997) TaxID=1381753 RepID=V2XRV3_MONRO|nr:hypothetical protein Moror_3474 [Moniliophthora roreri MCA 2997]